MFDYSFSPKITREFLLSKNNQETYMSYYLGIPIKKGLYKSPLRNDTHVTCSFFIGKSGNLYFKDFATGESLTFEGVVMKKYNCNYAEALNIIAKDFGFIKGANHYKTVKIQPSFKDNKQTYIQVKIKEYNEAELKWWNSFGITSKILNKFRVYCCDTVFLNGSIYAQSTQHSPIYGYYFGKKENIEQWRIYIPQRKEFRFIGNVSTKTIQGFKQLPKEGNLLVITKSLKDVMCLYSLGITAIAPNSETQQVDEKLLKSLKQRFKYIVYFYDNDLPGIRGMKKIRNLYPELMYYWIPRRYEAKDISDFYKKYGRDYTLKFIKHEILKWLKNR